MTSAVNFVAVPPNARLMHAVQRLRFQVYCRERGFLAAAGRPDEREFDEFDDHSLHFAAVKAGEVVATLRLVLDSRHGFPLERHATLIGDIAAARSHTAEISRLIIAADHRRRPQCSDGDLLFGLLAQMYRATVKLGLDWWIAAMEPGLLRLLRRLGLLFEPIGPPVEYHGAVLPCCASTDLDRVVAPERPEVLGFFLDAGKDLAATPA